LRKSLSQAIETFRPAGTISVSFRSSLSLVSSFNSIVNFNSIDLLRGGKLCPNKQKFRVAGAAAVERLLVCKAVDSEISHLKSAPRNQARKAEWKVWKAG
jgi:hypothetical protein